ncbi:restriction endonuclease subunit S [Vibrio parahaemolyticus]|uniref:restriction endonuclease subunit S n=1 Tax=Vibrio parahaemolyticus TaxID=670 RepID=UPI00215C2C1A|nr:restriction endonuclease subunit S [Vibrio parahaemolyticus]EKH9208462.1 restriction endonuclease subunit S [Vibrio parahaemolyticus]MCR9888670.1 restriction endonuclease subunit S [Vibrio parahaemolyticus]MCR9920061.1 restriction endonuclease subunit S [Vibrio parahaemolyticus]
MTGRYKAYPEYKESGVEWLGAIPKCWIVKKLKYLCQVQTGSRDTVNAVDNGKYPFFVRSQTVERINTVGAECEAVLTAGDGVGVGKVYHYFNGKFDYHQRVYMLNNFHNVSGRFVYYYLSSNFYKVAMEGNAKSTVDSLRLPQFLNFEFSLPLIEVQNKIVNFLDHETAKIDTLITKQEKLIELLKEKRQAVISHAVTKGLNPDVPMKDSGVEWLGEVPEHWDMKRLKYLGEAKNGLTYSPDDVVSQEEGVLVLRSSNIQDAKLSFTDNVYVDMDIPSRIRTKENDLLICSRNGSRKLIGKNALITKEAVDMAFGAFMVIFRSEVNPYLYWVLNSPLFEYQSGSFLTSTINQLTIGNLEGMEVPLPPKNEQEDIKAYLINKTIKFDQLINKAVYKVKLLNERKTALISAAVTGKIDVR